MTEQETVISLITSCADDPLMKAVIANQAIPGTTEAFRRIRERRPDILLFAGIFHEDPSVIASASDLVIDIDNVSRGYLMILAAKKLGCSDFVHISFPRHMSYELLSRRARIMQVACEDLGLKFHFESAPDPTSDVGLAGAQQFILEQVPLWVAKYGPNTAFFCTNNGETEPLLKRIAEGKGYFIEADTPSPLMGYPGALGIDLSDVAGNFPAITKKVEEAVVAKGGGGRMGTWTYSFNFTTATVLSEYAKICIENNVNGKNFRRHYKKEEVLKMYNEATPGATWNAAGYIDASTGIDLKNMLLMCQDTYILGSGYMHMTEVEVPAKYSEIK